MAYIQTDLDEMDRVIKSGRLIVQFANGMRVQYQSGADLLKAREMIRREIVTAAGATVRRTIVRTRKGW